MSDNVRAGCPVDEWASDGPRRAPLEHFERIDALRNRNRPFFWTTTAQGYFVFTDHDAIVEGLQNATLFSSSAVVPEMPDPPYRWIPQMLDPPGGTGRRCRSPGCSAAAPRRAATGRSGTDQAEPTGRTGRTSSRAPQRWDK